MNAAKRWLNECDGTPDKQKADELEQLRLQFIERMEQGKRDIARETNGIKAEHFDHLITAANARPWNSLENINIVYGLSRHLKVHGRKDRCEVCIKERSTRKAK